ncbi:sodium-coupled monocarboxylate transporter 1-like [Mytilus californianus]|uniref:sodium-coupled monocarboxylate transporter 1-like n=1 Tax=Mytilus californianus TaxID=6549 RepID=UPI002246E28C|nr:sodium-coupled monocarboxylate transporter 1-like [Mytilus californianus]
MQSTLYQRNEFSTLDYIIFVVTLVISLSIGIYNAFKSRYKQSTKEVLLAGGEMGVIPVAFSLFASFISSVSMIGIPAEAYIFDSMVMWGAVAAPISIYLSAYIYIPIFYNLKLTNAYEYLELRFSKSVRILVTICFCVYMIMYMAIVLYAPALAFNAVTGLSLWGTILSAGIVCILYTSIGGMKAVLWTDSFQAVLMLTGILVTLILGTVKVGGIAAVWKIADENGRINFTDFSFNMSTRYTVWSAIIGQAFMWITLFGTNQAMVQRTLTCPTLKHSQRALWISVPGLMMILVVGGLNGLVVFAYYHTCDPLSTGTIKAGDQLLPLFVMDIMGRYPGVSGIFIAAVFSGALSSVSSGLNAMSAALLQDIVKPFLSTTLTDKRAAIISKFIVLVLGIVCLVFVYIASAMGGVVKAAVSMFGILGSPICGVITLGMIFPWSNTKGAFVGTIVGIAMMTWIGIGSFLYKKYPISPLSTEGCMNYTSDFGNHTRTLYNFTASIETLHNSTASVEPANNSSTIFPLYDLSFLWFNVLGPGIVIVVGLIVSFVTGYTDPKSVDARYICPIFDVLCPYLPEKIRKPLRFGIVHKHKFETPDTFSKMIPEPQNIVLNVDDKNDEREEEILLPVNLVEKIKDKETVQNRKTNEKYL